MNTKIKWYHVAQTGEVGYYEVYPDNTVSGSMKGLQRAYGDGLTVGFSTKEKANTWGIAWGYCSTCKSACKGTVCEYCNGKIIHKPIKE